MEASPSEAFESSKPNRQVHFVGEEGSHDVDEAIEVPPDQKLFLTAPGFQKKKPVKRPEIVRPNQEARSDHRKKEFRYGPGVVASPVHKVTDPRPSSCSSSDEIMPGETSSHIVSPSGTPQENRTATFFENEQAQKVVRIPISPCFVRYCDS